MLHAEVVSAKLSILMYTDNWYVVTNNTIAIDSFRVILQHHNPYSLKV